MNTTRICSIVQLFAAVLLGLWSWYWIPRIASRPISELPTTCERCVAPSWARSFYSSHGAIEYSSSEIPANGWSSQVVIFAVPMLTYLVLVSTFIWGFPRRSAKRRRLMCLQR